MQRSEDNMQESVLSFYHAGSKEKTYTVRFGGKWLPDEPFHWPSDLPLFKL